MGTVKALNYIHMLITIACLLTHRTDDSSWS